MKIDFTPFVNSMNRTFSDMLGAELLNGPYEELEGDEMLADVSVNIGLSGDEKAVLVLTANESAGLLITKLTTGKDVKITDRIVSDTMGELLNMIVGAAQRHSNIKFDFSIPMAVSGSNHSIRSVFKGKYRRVNSKMHGVEVGLYLIESDG